MSVAVADTVAGGVGAPSEAGTNSSDQIVPSATPLEGAELEAACATQIEFYFSRDNLAQDSFLVQQMNADLFVPITVIASFKKLATLTRDVEVIKKVMTTCSAVELSPNGDMVRPGFKLQRNTIILREISSETPVEEVKTIFDDDECAKPTEVRPDYQDTWFVLFESEDDAFKTFMYIRGKKFKDKPIMCRIKAENLLRSFYAAPKPAAPAGGASGLKSSHQPNPQAAPFDPSRAVPYYTQPMYMVQNQYGIPMVPQGQYIPYQQWDPKANGYNQSYNKERRQGQFQRGGNNRRDKNNFGGRKNNMRGENGPRGGDERRKRNKRNERNKKTDDSEDNIQLGLTNFPPLPTAQGTNKEKAGGYEGEFRSYSSNALASIIKGLGSPSAAPKKHDNLPVFAQAAQTTLETEKPLPVPGAERASPEPEKEGNGVAGKKRTGSTSKKTKRGGANNKQQQGGGAKGAEKKEPQAPKAAAAAVVVETSVEPAAEGKKENAEKKDKGKTGGGDGKKSYAAMARAGSTKKETENASQKPATQQNQSKKKNNSGKK